MHLPGNQPFDSSRHTKSFYLRMKESAATVSITYTFLLIKIHLIKSYFKTHSPTYCPTHSEYNDSMQRNCKTPSVSLEKTMKLKTMYVGFFSPQRALAKNMDQQTRSPRKSWLYCFHNYCCFFSMASTPLKTRQRGLLTHCNIKTASTKDLLQITILSIQDKQILNSKRKFTESKYCETLI